MSTDQACPWCGSTDILRTIPEKEPFHVMVVCNQCQKVIPGNDSPATFKATAKRAIEAKTIELCMSMGKLEGIMYYLAEMNKLPGNNLGLKDAKEAVEALIGARGISSAVKKPNKNGCVIVLIILVLITACVIYFFTYR